MGGIVFVQDERWWSVSSSVFYWAIDALAEKVSDHELAAQLREVSEENLGSIDLEEMPVEHQRDLSATAAQLPGIARATLPPSDQRDVIIGQIEELASMLQPVRG